MTTPILMLVLLMLPAAAAAVFSRVTRRSLDLRAAAALGLGMVFIFTGIGHFTDAGSMVQMLPPWVPARGLLVFLSGLLELALALGFFMPQTRRFAAWVALALLIGFFPVNIYAAVTHAPMGGHAWGPLYLLIRTPVQVVMGVWLYWFILRPADTLRQRYA